MQNHGFYQSGGAIGFRDQLQDALSTIFLNPEILKNQILKAVKTMLIQKPPVISEIFGKI